MISASLNLSVPVTWYAVVTNAFQAKVASVAPACCSRNVVSMNHAVMMCVFKGKIVVVKAVLITLTALMGKFAVVRRVQMARIASVITDFPTLSVHVTQYAVIPDAFQATVPSVAPACCSRIVVSMNHAVMICVFTGKIVVVKAVLITLTALLVKFAAVRSVQMARIASVGPVRRVAIVKLQKAVVEGLVKVQIPIYTSP